MVKKKKTEKNWEEFGKTMGQAFSKKHVSHRHGIGFPLLLVLIGVYLLGRELGWFPTTISIWPFILIVIGSYWIILRLINWKK